MKVIGNGKFTEAITPAMLAKGIKSDSKSIRNSGALIKCSGAIGKDGMLQILSELDRIDTSEITDDFPYPQIFVEVNFIVVCSATKIYELVNQTTLEEKFEVTAGSTWSLVAFHDFAYLSNAVVAVTRSAETGEYTVSDDLPTAMSICNYNGQVIIGAPDAGYNI